MACYTLAALLLGGGSPVRFNVRLIGDRGWQAPGDGVKCGKMRLIFMLIMLLIL